MSVFPNALVFISFSVISLLVFHVFLCVLIWNRSHILLYYNHCLLICKSATSHKFLRSKLYIFHKNIRKTNKPVRTSQKNLVFFCACPAITHKPAKKEQVFFSQKICPCSAITYNFYPLSAGIFSATCEIPVPQVHIPF